jgi:alpha-glucosidase
MEPEEFSSVAIRLRVAHGDDVIVQLVTAEQQVYDMYCTSVGEMFDVYKVRIQLTDQIFSYYFQIQEGRNECFYDRFGASQEVRPEYFFSIIPGFATPDWAKGAVMYQILVDRFYNGDPGNDVLDQEYYYIRSQSQHSKDWNKPPEEFSVAEFYGGDLEGVRQKLYYLRSLGVEVIYFNPIFVSPSNHKYDIADYDHVDPHLTKLIKDEGEVLQPGEQDNSKATRYICRATDPKNLAASNAFFAQFIEEAHAKGIRVILDGVFNHCGSFNKWLDREGIYQSDKGYPPGAYQEADSPYRDYFSFSDPNGWPHNNSYEGWWGHDVLPKLNYEGSRDLYEYILAIGKKWVSPPFNADGWRLDVAADLGHSNEFNHQFWRDFRDAVKTANPDAIILAEHYGDASGWLSGGEWDTVMNYDAFMEPVSYFITGMEKHSDAQDLAAQGDGERFKNTMLYFMTKFTTPSLQCAMNQLSNHDHSRFLTRTNQKVGRVSELGYAAASEGVNIPLFKEAILIQMTWPGAPTLYYGDEAGQCGFTDPDNRRTYPWDHVNYELLDFYRDMILVHKMSRALRRGSFLFLTCGHNFISYGRFDDTERYIAAVYTGRDPMTEEIEIPVGLAEVEDGMMYQAFLTNEKGYSIMPVKHQVSGGKLRLRLDAYSAIILKQEA